MENKEEIKNEVKEIEKELNGDKDKNKLKDAKTNQIIITTLSNFIFKVIGSF